MNKIKTGGSVISIICLLMFCISLQAENIDPYENGSQYAYGENVGWLNFEPNTDDGVQVAFNKLIGFIWAENIGWISMSCENTASCSTVNYGVTNDGDGNLSGYAWAENVGWVSFSCDNTSSCGTVDYGVTIDANGNFDGYAWSENIGWIHLASTSPVPYKVQACVVTMHDLQNFASYWLDPGAVAGNLDNTDNVNNADFAVFAKYWQDFCPDGWRLK